MGNPTAVNAQVTDAVTQTNVKVVGEAPAEAIAAETQAMAHSIGLAMENATATQGGMQQINNAATGTLISQITGAQSSAAKVPDPVFVP
ncbi:MAG TPA: RebB family R body protein [Rhizomicrobium sp.]|jgi:hypothetical protein